MPFVMAMLTTYCKKKKILAPRVTHAFGKRHKKFLVVGFGHHFWWVSGSLKKRKNNCKIIATMKMANV